MQLLKVISRLLDYPTQDLLDNAQALIDVVSSSQYLPPELRGELVELIEEREAANIYDLQEEYDELFERGRYFSLLIFEHVHGESRDRGQAMVDLLEMYKSKDYELDSSQMPDYIPLFLEFLSEQDEIYAREWLADIGHILALLEERLKKRESGYQYLLTSLLILSGVKIDKDEIKKVVEKEVLEDSMEAIDKAWEDKEIRFDDPIDASTDAQSCPSYRPAELIKKDGIKEGGIKKDQIIQTDEMPINWHENINHKSLQG